MLKVSLPETMPVGTFDDTLNIATNRIPLQVSCLRHRDRGDSSVDPPQVSFGIVPHRGSARANRADHQPGKRPVKLLGLESSNTSVGASVEPVTPGKEYKVTVLLRKTRPTARYAANW